MGVGECSIFCFAIDFLFHADSPHTYSFFSDGEVVVAQEWAAEAVAAWEAWPWVI